MQSKENMMKMFEMRLEGRTLEEIGQHFGITRERVRQILAEGTNPCGRSITKCVFPGIVNWPRERRCTIKTLCDGTNCMCYNAFNVKMRGEQELKMSQIKAILAYTGMTFEEAFGEEIKPTDNG